jgi:hypothetical protein
MMAIANMLMNGVYIALISHLKIISDNCTISFRIFKTIKTYLSNTWLLKPSKPKNNKPMISAKMAANISSIAEPGEARLPSAPPARRVLYLPKTAPQLAG